MTECTPNGSTLDNARAPFGTPVISPAKEATKGPRVLRFETLPHRHTGLGKEQPGSSDSVTEHHAYNDNSSAVRSLRRYSEASLQAEDLNPTPLLQSISSTFTMLFASKNPGGSESSSDEDVESATDVRSRKKSKNRMSHAAKHRRRAKAKELNNPTASLVIPATITLRKASDACQPEPTTAIDVEPVAAEIVHDDGPAFQAAVSAMAFQSRAFDLSWLSSFEEHQTSRVSFRKDSGDGPGAARQMAMSVAGISRKSEVRRHSVLAETALTLEEAHLDPSEFTTSPNPRRNSTSAVGTLRRLSTIRAGLRGSVHEIIWQEDEISSGTSSRTSVSPSRKELSPGSTSNGSEPRPFNGGFAGTELNTWSTDLSELGSSSKGKQSVFHDAMLHLRQSYGNMLDWSSNEQPPGVANSTLHPSDPPTIAATCSNSESRERRPSISITSRIQSFPPLSPRRHTSEWRRAPLPDLNDPTIGQAPHELAELKYPDGFGSLMDRGLEMYASIPNAVSASMAPDVDAGLVRKTVEGCSKLSHAENGRAIYVGRWARDPKRSKSVSHVPFAPVRMAVVGKVGSSIGISSHKRVAR